MIRHANQHIHRAARNRRFDDKNSRGGNVYTLRHDISSTSVAIDLTTRFLTYSVDNYVIDRRYYFKEDEGRIKKRRSNPNLKLLCIIFTDDNKNTKKRKVLLLTHAPTFSTSYESVRYKFTGLEIPSDSPIIWNGPSKIIIKCNLVYDFEGMKSGDRSELEHVGHVKVQKTGELVLV